MDPLVVKKNRNKLLVWISGAVFLSFILTFTILGLLVLNQKTIYENIYIESIYVGDLSGVEAKKKLESVFEKERQRHHLRMKYEETDWDISYEQLDFYYLYEDALYEAYSIGRKGSYIARLREIYAVRKSPVVIPLAMDYDYDRLEEIIEEIIHTVNKRPMDASITRRNNTFTTTKSVKGVAVDEIELRREIQEALDGFSNEIIYIPVEYVEPSVTEEQLAEITDTIGSFSTVFDASVSGRSTNIALASNSINGTLLMPGDTFSFNEQTGPRGVSEGYQEAPVILNGQLVPGIGGGICQVSTTLYNAVVRADLEITKRQNHSLAVAYVPLGHDAVVAYGYLDLTFINNTQYPIYIESYVQGNGITVNIHGKEFKDYTIDLYSEVIDTIEPDIEVKKDPSMYVGQRKVEKQAKNGYKVDTYKVYKRNNKEFRRELISKDTYSAVNGVVIEGSKVKPQVQEDIPQNREDNHEYIPTDADDEL